jgi:hypothetical protein
MGFVPDAEPQGRFVPDATSAPEPMPIAPIEGIWAADELPTAKEVIGPAVRHGLPAAAGIAAGSIPGAGLIAGPLAAATTDLALSKIYGEGEDSRPRETSFLTDVGVGLLPSAAKGVYSIAKKAIPAPLEAKIASTIKWGFEKGVRPTVAGKGNAAQTAQYYKKAQSATESIIKNKPNLKFTTDTGEAVVGRLPQNLNEFSQSIDQTKREIFKQYDAMLKNSESLGRTVDLDGVVSELKVFQTNRVNKMVGATGNNRADFLIENMSGQKLSLSEAQDMIAQLNGRLKAFYANPSPDLASSAAIDALTANRLRIAVDSAVEKFGYQELKNQYGALRSIEKEVSNRALVDARKNAKGLLDFADIATAAEAARAVTSMSVGPAAAAGAIKAMKEYYKYLNNPNRVIRKMFSEADVLISKRAAGAIPLKALPPGPRRMPGKTSDSYARGVQGEYPVVSDMGEVIPGRSPSDIEEEIRKYGLSAYDRIRRGYLGETLMSPPRRQYLGTPYEELERGLFSGGKRLK